jgi:hypothetical protein
MFRKLIIIILVSMASLFFSKEAFSAYPHNEIGLEFSMTSGAGISYQYKHDVDWTFKLTGVGFKSGEDLPHDGDFYGSLGLNIQRNFFNNRDSRAYAYIGAGAWYAEHAWTETIWIYDRELIKKNRIYNHIYNYGIGAGYEIILRRNFILTFELGVMYQQSDDTKGFDLHEVIDYSPSEKSYIGPSGSIGFKIRIN